MDTSPIIPHFPIHYATIHPTKYVYPQQQYYLTCNSLSPIFTNQNNSKSLNIALFAHESRLSPLFDFYRKHFFHASIHIFITSDTNTNDGLTNKNIYSSQLSYDNKKQLLDQSNIIYDIIVYDITDSEMCLDLEYVTNEINLLQNYLHAATGVLFVENINLATIPLTEYSIYFEPFMQLFSNIFAVSLYFQNITALSRHLLIFQKNVPSFCDEITIITPSIRPENLRRIASSVNFEYFSRWIIVYDSTKIKQNPNQFADCPYIEEYLYSLAGNGRSGNDQRNFALSIIPANYRGYIYFLDDDNIIHPNFYQIVRNIVHSSPNQKNQIYTFDQERYNNSITLRGNRCEINKIDSAMALIPAALCRNIRWKRQLYNADGHFIQEVYNRHSEGHVYIETHGCYYNSNQ